MERTGEGGVGPGETLGNSQRGCLGLGDVGTGSHPPVSEQVFAVLLGVALGSGLALAVAKVVAPDVAGDCLGSFAALF